MDLSVFNVLMSTNPNTSVEDKMFSDAVQSGIPVSSVEKDGSLKTEEAFWQVLDQLRAGHTEKSGESFYNAANAHAEASSPIKTFGKDGASKENVKVIRVHIKRTRASETLRKAEEAKNASAAPAADGQKIPTKETTAPVQAEQSVQPQQDTSRDTVQEAACQEFTAVSEPAEKKDIKVSDFEEITAADILISAALQGTIQAQAPVQTIVRAETNENEAFVATTTLPQEQIAAPVQAKEQTDLSQNTETQTVQPLQQDTAAPVMPQDSLLPQETKTSAVLHKDNRPVIEKKAEQKTEETVVASPDEKPESFSHLAPRAVKTEKAPVLSDKTQTQAAPVTNDTVELTQTERLSFDQETPAARQSRRQAEQLASQLPAENNIAITVETQMPATASVFTPLHKNAGHTESRHKQEAQKNDEISFILPEQNEFADTKPAQKTSTLQSADTEQHHRQNDAAQQTEQQQPDALAAMPAQSRLLPQDSANIKPAQEQPAQTGISSVSTTPAASLPLNHEIRGKAVSGTPVMPKSVPVNELVDQIKVNIKKALKEGLDKIDIIMKPKELGTIKIHLEIGKDGTMKAVLNTARAETLNLLQSDLSILKQALADSGFDLNDQAFTFNYRGEQYQDGQKHSSESRSSSDTTETDEETTVEAIDTVAGSLSISGRYALNIRV